MNRNYKAQTLKLHNERLEKVKAKGQPRYNGSGEAEVVPGYELSEILREWVVRFLAERPLDTNGDFVGPHAYLSEQTGIHTRRVSGIINGEFTLVPLSQADKLLQAIDRPDCLHQIHVIPNPNWSPERWHEYMAERGCV
jgi:hypothetical protein